MRPLQRRLAAALLGSGAVLAAAACVATNALGSMAQSLGTASSTFGASVPLLAAALGLQAALALLLWRTLPRWHPHPRLGPAHRVTLGRATLVVLLAALALTTSGAALQAPAFGWALVGLATLAATLDAVDGPLARRSGMDGPAGARFDMETDALLVAVLSLLLWRMERAGAWVLLSGGLRYGFVAAALAWPWLAAPLPPSLRRKAVCVLQIVVAIVALAPVVPPALAASMAAFGLAALLLSFAIDVVHLASLRPRAASPVEESA